MVLPNNVTVDGDAAPPLHTEAFICVPANPAVVTVLEAIWKGSSRSQRLVDGWRENNGRLEFIHSGRRGGRIRVSFASFCGMEALKPLTADLALAVLAEFARHLKLDSGYDPCRHPIRVAKCHLNAYCSANTQGMGPLDKSSTLRKEMEKLLSLRIDVENYPFWDKPADRYMKQSVSWHDDRLIDAVEDTSDGGPCWLVRAGHWARYWLNPQSRLYMANLDFSLLRLDGYGERNVSAKMARRIGQRLLMYRPAARSSTVVELKVSRILTMIGELVAPDERSKQWAGRTRDRFEDALLSLQEAGIVASVQWPTDYGPGDPDRFRGWVAGWLDATVRIVFRGGANAAAAGVEKADYIDAYSRLRAVRIARGWTQEQLAADLGISAAYVSLIETGQRTPGEQLGQRLVEWLRRR